MQISIIYANNGISTFPSTVIVIKYAFLMSQSHISVLEQRGSEGIHKKIINCTNYVNY